MEAETKLKELKEVFLYIIQNMDSDILEYVKAEIILDERNFRTFEPIWTKLHTNQPYNELYSEQIKTDLKEISQKMPQGLHNELALAIIEDYKLMANYLIAEKNDWRIASMFLSYSRRNIPSAFIKSTVLVRYSFMVLKDEIRVAKLRAKYGIKNKQNLE